MRILLRAGNTPFEIADASLSQTIGRGNSGNLLFAHSVYKSLYTPGNQIDVDRYRPDFASADEINERYDIFALPLANAFRPRFEDHLKQYTATIRRLKIPCVVTGIGAQAGLDLAELQGAAIDASVRGFVSAVLDRSASIGVRGEITHAYLKRLGFSAVDTIGCPSLFLNADGLGVRKKKAQLAIDDPIALNHSPGVRREIEALIGNTFLRYPDGVLVAQEEKNRQHWETAALGLLNESAAARVRHFVRPPEWIGFMATRVFSIGTRIHGNIAALLAGTPALVIVHDSRTLELAQYHKIPHVLAGSLDADSDIAALYEKIDVAPVNTAFAEQFAHYKTFLEANGLHHGFDDPTNAARFEARLSAT